MDLEKRKETGWLHMPNINLPWKALRNLLVPALVIVMASCKPNLERMSLPELQEYLCDLTSKINDGADVQGLIAWEHNIGIDEDNGKDREQVNIILQWTSNRSKENTKDFNEALNEINRVRKEIDKRMANWEGGWSNHQYMDADALDNARNIINAQQKYRENNWLKKNN